jgi:predicted dehydrogenase
VFTSIESNAFDQRYEEFMGTKGTLILRNETEALLFDEGGNGRATGIKVSPKSAGAALDASESRPPDAPPASRSVAPESSVRPSATKNEIARFCEAVRVHRPIACGPERAMHSAKACMLANQAVEKKTLLRL